MRANWLARLWPLWTLALLAAGCNGPPLSILPATLPNAVEDTSYSETLSTDGQGVLHWEIADGALPPGMTLGEDSGVISGRPTQAGTFDFAVVANNESPPLRTGEESYSLVVLERLTVDFTLPAARVSEAYEGTPVIAGSVPPYTAKIVGLPAGLDYDPATGKITGTPLNDNAGLRLDLSVTDSGEPQQLATARTYLAIHPIGVTIVTTTLADAAAGVAYSTSV